MDVTCVACGAANTAPDDRDLWDVTTDADGVIVERHYAAICVACAFLSDVYGESPSNIVSEAVNG